MRNDDEKLPAPSTLSEEAGAKSSSIPAPSPGTDPGTASPGTASVEAGKAEALAQARRSQKAHKIIHRMQQLLPVLALLIFAVALYFIHHILKQHSYQEIVGYVNSIPLKRRWIALGGTVLSYLLLSGYDLLGFRYIKNPIAWHKIVFGSFTAFAFGNNIGMANLAGSSIRLRIYSTYGVDPKDTLKIIAFNSATFWFGFFALAGTMLSLSPIELPPSFGVSAAMVQVAGVALLLCAIGYLATSAIRRKPIVIYGYSIELPGFGLSFAQVMIAAGDWALAGFVLYILLPDTGLTYPQFLTIFVSAQVVAMITHVPGGVGILEAMVIYFVAPDHQSNPGILGGLIAFRAIYYLLPLVTAAVFLFIYEVYRKRHMVSRVGNWTGMIVPSVASILTFGAGATMLFASVTPLLRSRLSLITRWLPLAVIETSYFLSSCIGVSLLVIAHALLNRSHAAWVLTMCLLVFGAFLSLTRGFEYESAVLLLFFAALLFASRGEFHRRPTLYATRLTPTWVAAVLMVLGGTVWIGLFAHRHFEYRTELWWTFAVHGGMPRFLRASVGGLATCIALALFYLLKPKALLREKPRPERGLSAEQILTIAETSTDSLGLLALSGSKLIFPSLSGRSFLLYTILKKPQVWCALGDPHGDPNEAEDLLFDFKEAAEAVHHSAIFYEIQSEKLPLYVELGLTFAPVGEQGLLDPASVRGVTSPRFTVSHPSAELALELERMAAITPGAPRSLISVPLNATALSAYPVAVLRDEVSVCVFAPLMVGANEVALDVPWFAPGQTAMASAFLAQVLLWARDRGSHLLSLGIAPLLPNHQSAAHDQLLAETHAQQGLKIKTRFLAYPAQLDLPEILQSLI